MQDYPDFKHLVILPKNSFFSILVERHNYILTRHAGKGFTLNYVRQAGYFTVKVVSVVKTSSTNVLVVGGHVVNFQVN